MASIEVKSRSKTIKPYSSNELSTDSLVQELIDELSIDNHISKHRLRITRLVNGKQIPLIPHETFTKNGIEESAESIKLYAKDLGPQISWRTVFLVEYFGPFIFHPLFYFFSVFYGVKPFFHTLTQIIAFNLVLLHFLKREYETVFVHKFSNATMPIFNIFKNSTHYWILSGFNLAYFVYAPTNDYTGIWKNYVFHVNELPTWAIGSLVLTWIFAEFSNFKTHSILSELRDKDPKKYVIPYGYGFDLVSCPNYFFESLSWFAYALLVGNWSAWLFFAVSTGQMWLWAVKKHKRYLKTFGDDYKKLKRKIFVPYVI
ncbi:TSC13 [Candida pseudojiufengensis]|uniref:TSC13 n=1 Tax=Candida pseudojiufengensis TaxID=497109 RepID=UPI00222437EC|nr:TSC13 [Candida pseudojiufengensis]KAI5961174.1 TSC13 [Candida pseudojiufengensis]